MAFIGGIIGIVIVAAVVVVAATVAVVAAVKNTLGSDETE